MTEIPEHLLKRSRDRRAALGLGGDDADSGETKPATPAETPASAPAAQPAATGPATRAAAPAPAEPEPPKPDSAVVTAYKQRRRMPLWAMAALSILPLWAFMYARALTEQPVEAAGPLGEGEEVYGNCASCHGGGGGGGQGYAFTDGEVLETFPNIEDQLRFVYFGTEAYNIAGVTSYGNPEREGGEHITGALGPMPGWGEGAGGDLTDEEILAVVCHERFTLGGADAAGDHAEEFEEWCSEESEIFTDLASGGLLADLSERFPETLPIGDAPAPGQPPEAAE